MQIVPAVDDENGGQRSCCPQLDRVQTGQSNYVASNAPFDVYMIYIRVRIRR